MSSAGAATANSSGGEAVRAGCHGWTWIGCPFSSSASAIRDPPPQRKRTIWAMRFDQRRAAVDGLYKTTDGKKQKMLVGTEANVPFIDQLPKNVYGKLGPYQKALTGTVGETWRRQRRAVTETILPAFYRHFSATDLIQRLFQQTLTEDLLSREEYQAPAVALSGAAPVVIAHVFGSTAGAKWICLTAYLRHLVGSWIADMIVGPYQPAGFLHGTFLPFWTAFRRKVQVRDEMHALHDKLTASLESITDQALKAFSLREPSSEQQFSCVLESMIASQQLDREEISGNLESFLTAGFETTYTIILVTLLMIASSPADQQLQQRILTQLVVPDSDAEAEEFKETFHAIKEMKKCSTSGKPFADYPSQTVHHEENILLRCLIETMRMCPPVWGLPRVNSEGIKVKIDVMCCNGVMEDWPMAWNPLLSLPESGHMACFGLGERSCPAGGTAFCVAYVLIKRFLHCYELLSADRLGLARSAYLAPSLCFEGEHGIWLKERQPGSALGQVSDCIAAEVL